MAVCVCVFLGDGVCGAAGFCMGSLEGPEVGLLCFSAGPCRKDAVLCPDLLVLLWTRLHDPRLTCACWPTKPDETKCKKKKSTFKRACCSIDNSLTV